MADRWDFFPDALQMRFDIFGDYLGIQWVNTFHAHYFGPRDGGTLIQMLSRFATLAGLTYLENSINLVNITGVRYYILSPDPSRRSNESLTISLVGIKTNPPSAPWWALKIPRTCNNVGFPRIHGKVFVPGIPADVYASGVIDSGNAWYVDWNLGMRGLWNDGIFVSTVDPITGVVTHRCQLFLAMFRLRGPVTELGRYRGLSAQFVSPLVSTGYLARRYPGRGR